MKFVKNDIIAPKDRQYPEGALIVDGYERDGGLLAHPVGGGLQYKIEEAKAAAFRVVLEGERFNAPYRRGTFMIEGIEQQYNGLTNGELWNGWAKPCFELPEAGRIVVDMNWAKGRFDDATDAFITVSPDGDAEVWPSRSVMSSTGGPVKAYPIGAGAWIWEEVPYI